MSAGIIDVNCVKYVCTCGLLKPLQKLYFCRYCSELRCSFCVSHEVDSHFCGKCCENLPSPEAKVKKNKCVNCFICPSCSHEVSTRAASKQPASPEESKNVKRTYYLLCLCCRWSTRDVGLPDQTAATGNWPKRENIHANRIQDIINMYKGMQEKEKQDKEFFKKKQREKIRTYTDLTGVTASALRKRIGVPEDKPLIMSKNAVKMAAPSIPEENVEDFPEDLLTRPVNLLEITTIDQRILQPDLQPDEVGMLFPIQKMLSIKRSLRCRTCEHNVSKPEYNPNSIKFKIQLFAYYHIPDVRIVTVQPLRAGKPSELILKFTNPTQHQTIVSFADYDAPFEVSDNNQMQNIDQRYREESSLEIPDDKFSKKRLSNESKLSDAQLSLMKTRTPNCTIQPRPVMITRNGAVEIPTSSFILPPRDDAAEYDDFNEAHNIQDDKKLVVRRKSNKAFIKLIVTPEEGIPIDTPVVTAFTITHLYTNTMTSVAENKRPQKFNHNVRIFLNLGNSVGSN